MFGPRVVGEGMERGIGESITANAMTTRPTNVTKTNQCPAFVEYRSIYKYACTHMLRSAFAHPPSSPYALTCPHALATASIVLFTNTRN